MAFLEVDDIKTYYGNIQALKGVSLTVEEGECVTLIGSNGAGKSTTLRSISGLTPPRTGSIRLAGDSIEHLPPQEIVRLGVCQSPEGQVLPAHDGPREPRARCVPAPRQRGDREGPGPRVRAVPAPGRAPGAEGGHDVRRRAADARDRPRADGQPADPAARRALDGDLANPHRAHLRDDRGDQQAGHDDPAGGAERELRARGLPARLRARDREGRHVRRLRLAADQPRSPEGVPRHMIGATAL